MQALTCHIRLPVTSQFLIGFSTAFSGRFSGVTVVDTGQFLVVWQDRRNGNDDIYGQRLSSSGGTSGSNFAIANAADTEQTPAVAWSEEAQVYLVVWHNCHTSCCW